MKTISFPFALMPILLLGLFAPFALEVGGFLFWIWALIAIGAVLISLSVRINNQWEETIVLRLGKYNRTTGPGIFFVLPLIENAITRDKRVRTVDIPRQEVITKDNISVGVDAVVFLKVVDTAKSIINIQDFMYAVKQYAQTTLRNIIGQKDLDELLEKREEIAKAIKQAVDAEAEKWGVDITGIELQNIELPKDLKRVMARQAEAEREKRAVIIKSKGEIEAAGNLKKAADILMKSKEKSALRLREFETLSDISYDQSNTIVFYPSGLGIETVLAGTALAKSTNYKEKKGPKSQKSSRSKK